MVMNKSQIDKLQDIFEKIRTTRELNNKLKKKQRKIEKLMEKLDVHNDILYMDMQTFMNDVYSSKTGWELK